MSGIYGPDGRLGEVEDEKAGKDFLEDEIRLFRMKMDEANGVFQAAEAFFYASFKFIPLILYNLMTLLTVRHIFYVAKPPNHSLYVVEL